LERNGNQVETTAQTHAITSDHGLQPCGLCMITNKDTMKWDGGRSTLKILISPQTDASAMALQNAQEVLEMLIESAIAEGATLPTPQTYDRAPQPTKDLQPA
jgi:predicted RNase H-like HicB family nuclease